jgi:uncharacterized protein (DUF433 family)
LREAWDNTMAVLIGKQAAEQKSQMQQEQSVPSHIVIGPDGQARVAGTGYKVRLMAGWHRFRGETADQMREGHPDLTMAQVYSVLAYYYDHKDEMDAEMDRKSAEAERMRLEAGESPVAKRLREAGLLTTKDTLTDEQLRIEKEAEAQAA